MNSLLGGVLLPATVSIVVALVILRILAEETARRYAGALGFAAGLMAAYALLEPHDLRPSMYWHWLPWMALGGGLIGPVTLAAGVRFPERCAAMLLLALVAAWFLVPTRASLLPVRSLYVAAFAGSVMLLWILLDRLATRGSTALVCGMLGLASLCGGALVAAVVSLRFGLLEIAASAALGGGFLAALQKQDDRIVRGLLPAQTVVACGIILFARVNVGLPPASLVLIPAAPLMLWLGEAGPLGNVRGRWGSLLRIGAVTLPLAVAWGLAAGALRSEPAW